MIKPIKPSEVVKKKLKTIPDEVIESFNDLIALNWDGYSSSFSLNDIKNIIMFKFSLNNKKNLNIKSEWLNIEEIYEKEGWEASYDKPDYGGPGVFHFKLKKKT